MDEYNRLDMLRARQRHELEKVENLLDLRKHEMLGKQGSYNQAVNEYEYAKHIKEVLEADLEKLDEEIQKELN